MIKKNTLQRKLQAQQIKEGQINKNKTNKRINKQSKE